MAASPSISEAARVLNSAPRRTFTKAERRRIARDAIDHERIIIWKALWAQLGNIRGDPREYIERVWARKLPKMYERLLAAAMAGEKVDAALDILKAMTVVTRTLAPSANKQLPADPTLLGLPSDADLSHLSDEDLARVLHRPLPGPDVGKPKRKPRRKALPVPDGVDAADSKDGATIAAMSNGRTNGEPWGGLDDDDDGTRSGNPHTPESKVSKGGKKKNNVRAEGVAGKDVE